MQTHDTNDFRDPLKTNGPDKPGQKAESPFAEALFGKDKVKDDKTKEAEKTKPGETPKTEEKAKEQKVLQENLTREQTDNLRAQERLQAQALFESRSEVLKGLLATILTSLQQRELQQPLTAPATPAVQPLLELGQAPAKVQDAFTAQLAGQVVQLEDIAKVNAWRAFNGNDALSKPTDGSPADLRLATLGRQLTEIQNLASFGEPIRADLNQALPNLDWLKDIKAISSQENLLAIQQPLLTELINRKAETLHYVMSQPQLAEQFRNLKNDREISQFLSDTELKLFPNPITIPGEVTAGNPLAQKPLEVRAEQEARRQFPGNDPVSITGRDLVRAQAFLNAGKVDQAKAVLDPSKAVANNFTDWRSDVFRADGSDPKLVLADKITALKEVVAVSAGKPVPAAIINSNFLSLMEANVASRRPGSQILPVEAEASRRAVLQLVSNPTVLNYVLQGKPAAEIEPTVRTEISRMATGIASQLPYTDTRYRVPLGNIPAPVDTLAPAIARTVTDITYNQPFKAIVLPPAPGRNAPQPPAPGDGTPARPVRATQPSPLDSTFVQPVDRIIAPSVLPESSASLADNLVLASDRTAPVFEAVRPANLAVGTAVVEPGAPVSKPAETPQFSMATLSSLFNRVPYSVESFDRFNASPNGVNFAAAELRQAQFNAATLVSPASDYFRPAPILLNTNADIIVQPATIIHTNLAEYPVAANNGDLSTSYNSNLNIPSPFESKPSEARLTGVGSNLDGANRGVMASGGSAQTRSTNLAFMARRSNSLSSGSLLSSSSGSLLGGNGSSSSTGGPSLGAGGKGGGSRSGGGRSGGGGTGLPLWHCGFLSPDRSGNIALGLNNRTIKKEEKDEDEEKTVRKEEQSSFA